MTLAAGAARNKSAQEYLASAVLRGSTRAVDRLQVIEISGTAPSLAILIPACAITREEREKRRGAVVADG